MTHYDEPPQSPYPQLPGIRDTRWQKVIARRGEQISTVLYHLPSLDSPPTSIRIQIGDTFQIALDQRLGNWIPARVGQHIGWLDMRTMRLLSVQTASIDPASIRETQPRPTVRTRSNSSHPAIDPRTTAETKPLTSSVDDDSQLSTINKNNVRRLIRHLASLGGSLKSAVSGSGDDRDDDTSSASV